MPVKRIEVFIDKQLAVVELQNQAVGVHGYHAVGRTDVLSFQDVGRVLLRSEPIVFGGNTLEVNENIRSKENIATRPFKPRVLGPSRSKAGLGFKKFSIVERSAKDPPASSSTGGKGQDDFRMMLERKQSY